MTLIFAILVIGIISISCAVFWSNERDAAYQTHKRQQKILRDHHKVMADWKKRGKRIKPLSWWRRLVA